MGQEQEQRRWPRDQNMNELFELIRRVAADVGELRALNSELTIRFEKHMDTEEEYYRTTASEIQRLSGEVESLSGLVRAFPEVDGKPDLRGHYDDHKTRMEDAKTSKARWEAIKTAVLTDAAKGITIAVVVIIGLGLKDWFTQFITKILSGG